MKLVTIMKIKRLLIYFFVLFLLLNIARFTLAEDKSAPGGIIPKLQKTANDPELIEGHVYPNWGPVCQRYTYSVIYRDKEGRKPQYVKIYFNGKMIDMVKNNPNDDDYQKGVKYIYKYVPNKLGSNFYYFEAANGLGKTRDAIIDSPDNGPVLFKSAFNKNQIVVVDKQTGKKILDYPTGKEWVGGIALSDDGRYLAAKTSKHIYLFDTNSPKEPLWNFNCEQCRIGDDVKGGIAISGSGSKIIAAFTERVALFDKSSNKPIWMYDKAGGSYNVAIAKNGKYMAAATAGEESNVNSNLLILWSEKSEKPLWQYHSSGNFHDVSLSDNGDYIAGSTGCPDRRAYLFYKNSNIPVIKTDPLTRDSPVHRAKISSDGSSFAVGSESDAGAVFFFRKNSKEPIWKFPVPQGSSVRALNFTPSGKYIGAATFGGQVFIFDSSSSQPISSWSLNNVAIGGIDIADDGSYITIGGTDKKLHIFEKGLQIGKEILFNEYVEEIDISANGKYIAAGTGGSVYFFETFDKDSTPVSCTNIIEPKAEEEEMAQAGFNGNDEQANSSLCGDGTCEGPETIDNCRQDCDPNYEGRGIFVKSTQFKLPGMLTGFAFLGSILALGVYYATVKFNLLRRRPEDLKKLNKRILMTICITAVLFLILTLVFMFLNKPKSSQYEPREKTPLNTDQDNRSGEATDKENRKNLNEKQGVCGNDICEPGLGESRESCSQDCSAQ